MCRQSSTQRLTHEVFRLIRKVGDDVIVRHGGRDYGFIVSDRINLHPEWVGTIEGKLLRRTDCRIRKSTVRHLRKLAANLSLIRFALSHCGITCDCDGDMLRVGYTVVDRLGVVSWDSELIKPTPSALRDVLGY